MKPLGVLLLVVLAVGGLLFAIFQLGGDDSTINNGRDLEIDLPSSPENPGRPGLLPPPEPASRTELDPATAPEEGRQQLATPQDYFENQVVGTVVDEEGRTIEGAVVTLTRSGPGALFFQNDPQDRSKDRKTKSDAQGSFGFRNVEPFDRYAIEVVADGYSAATASQVNVGVAGTFFQQQITLTTGQRLYGRVEDSGKNAVPGAVIYLDTAFYTPGAGEESPDRLTAVTNAQGEYEILNVPPGNRTLTVMADGYANVQMSGLVFRGEKGIERSITLEIAERITGTVINQEGAPVPDAQVQAICFSSSTRQCRELTATDESGQFTLERLAAGQYTIAVAAEGYRRASEPRVQTGESGLIIELVRQATVSGRVIAIDTGQPVPQYTVRLRQTYPQQTVTTPVTEKQTFEKEDGSFTLTAAQPGTYLVEALADGYAPSYSESFRMVQGQSITGIVVTLTKGGSITGTVLGPDGPVARALITTHDNTWSNSVFDQALGDEFPTNATSTTGRSNGKGEFVVAGIKGETYQIRVKASGYCEFVKQDILVRDGVATSVGEILLRRGGRITGRVLDASGAPTAATVSLLPDGRQPGMPQRYKVKSQPDGTYELGNVEPGNYKLSATVGNGGGDFLGQFQSQEASVKRVTISDGQELHYDLQIGN